MLYALCVIILIILTAGLISWLGFETLKGVPIAKQMLHNKKIIFHSLKIMLII